MSIAQTWLLPLSHGLGDAQGWAGRLLGAVELAEMERYSSNADRRLAQISRAVGRLAATRLVHGTVAPETWAFERTSQGGRLLRAPDGRLVYVGIADNESILVVCADAAAGSGVDIESWRPPSDWTGIADRFFAPLERFALSALPRDEAASLFTLLWTGKEAVAKARGIPLADMLGTPISSGSPIDLRRWLADGIACDAYNVHWFDQGIDILAMCGAPKRHFAEPCTVSLEVLANQVAPSLAASANHGLIRGA